MKLVITYALILLGSAMSGFLIRALGILWDADCLANGLVQ